VTPDDDLNIPLGVGKTPTRRRVGPSAMLLVAGLLGAVLAVFVAWSLLVNDPLGGEPTVTVKAGLATGDAGPGASTAAPAAEGQAPMRTAAAPPFEPIPNAREPIVAPGQGKTSEAVAPAGPAGRAEQTVTIIDGKSGARQEVKIPAAEEPALVGGETRLVEMTRNGPIPRVGPDGLRAAQAYARPFQAKPNSPQIAIVVAGLGVSANATTEAINKLPGAVTFAFAPYGTDLERATAKARSLGHELLLQVPMEPFDYPDNDPGPQTLTTALSPEQNIERLQWAMSRFRGYVGVANQMGARFTTSELSFSPIMREIGRRGLIFVDDGSSPRSLASQIAGGNSLAFVRSNLTLDAVPSAGDIDRALVRLEAMARENGVAVGFVSALPVSIERISLWAKTAESRGFTLAPISAAAARTKAS
jgi:uncharacterized protein